jgi:hypothetical protein
MRIGWIPEATCEACGDVSSRIEERLAARAASSDHALTA